jgi:hypothetical protein
VSQDFENYLALLEQRLSLLRLLAQEFVDGRKDFVALDPEGMYRRISEQEELCRQIQRLHPVTLALQQTCATQLGEGSHVAAVKAENADGAERLTTVVKELGKAQAEVGRLNQIHAAYLRRSRKTISVLMNYVGRYSMTYKRSGETVACASTLAERG